jgi:hypothetical protein
MQWFRSKPQRPLVETQAHADAKDVVGRILTQEPVHVEVKGSSKSAAGSELLGAVSHDPGQVVTPKSRRDDSARRFEL